MVRPGVLAHTVNLVVTQTCRWHTHSEPYYEGRGSRSGYDTARVARDKPKH